MKERYALYSSNGHLLEDDLSSMDAVEEMMTVYRHECGIEKFHIVIKKVLL